MRCTIFFRKSLIAVGKSWALERIDCTIFFMNIQGEFHFPPFNDYFFMALVGRKVLHNFLSWLW